MRPAKGTKGVLLTGQGSILRVYYGNGKFTDYEIRHHDLDIEIIEEHAIIKETTEDAGYIDYDPATLGIEGYE